MILFSASHGTTTPAWAKFLFSGYTNLHSGSPANLNCPLDFVVWLASTLNHQWQRSAGKVGRNSSLVFGPHSGTTNSQTFQTHTPFLSLCRSLLFWGRRFLPLPFPHGKFTASAQNQTATAEIGRSERKRPHYTLGVG